MTKFKFSVGPWNVHSGADSYGPATRDEIAFEEKIRTFAELGQGREPSVRSPNPLYGPRRC